jgi:PAS domain S-box-containing protein
MLIIILIQSHLNGGDMTVKTKEQLSEKQAAGYFWKLFELNAVPMTTWDLNGKITNANNAFLELIGYSRRELEEQKVDWRNITPTESVKLDEKCIQQLKEKGIAEPYEKKFIRKDGTLVKARIYVATLKPGEDHGVGIVMPVK